MRLTMWQVVLQSQLIHPDWSPEIHLAFLEQEGYDTQEMEFGPTTGWTPAEIVERWLRQNMEAGRAPVTAAAFERVLRDSAK
jgi:hypothetical protein